MHQWLLVDTSQFANWHVMILEASDDIFLFTSVCFQWWLIHWLSRTLMLDIPAFVCSASIFWENAVCNFVMFCRYSRMPTELLPTVITCLQEKIEEGFPFKSDQTGLLVVICVFFIYINSYIMSVLLDFSYLWCPYNILRQSIGRFNWLLNSSFHYFAFLTPN